MGRPCLLFDIERCCGPCVGEVTREEYAGYVDGLADVLEGKDERIRGRLNDEMTAAANRQEYETAARLRDRIQAIDKALERQEVVSHRREDFDLLAIEEDDLEAAVVVLHVRHGRVTGRLATVVDKVEDVAAGALVARMIGQLYGDTSPPRAVLVQQLPEDADVWADWLAGRRGSAVALRVPQRGAKRRLMETAHANARDEFARHRMRRQSDHNSRAKALRSLQDYLELPHPPLRIECYDISTIQGRDTVGSMVVLEDGLPRRTDYRRFKVRTVPGQDDFAAMEEVLTRRFANLMKQQELPVEERGRFAYPPSLVLIDGGIGQLGRAVKVLAAAGLEVPVAGLAKRMEEVYVPGRTDPIRIPRGEDALYLLQRVRDEAHRFAVTYHRQLRGKRMIDSMLDDVPGVGAARKRALLRRFGSLKRLREANETELAEVIPPRVARDLYKVLHEEDTS
jgi:excinuclease ABC subunit C